VAAAVLGGVDNIWIKPGSKVLYIGAAAGESDCVSVCGFIYMYVYIYIYIYVYILSRPFSLVVIVVVVVVVVVWPRKLKLFDLTNLLFCSFFVTLDH
jgi:hypothetical protein